MFLNPRSLSDDLDALEEIEKATLRAVTQPLVDFRRQATEIFQRERDLPGDIGEDITREALDAVGMSRVDKRLFGKVDYKKARYLFLPQYAIRQALFVDSKAEKDDRTITIQTSQTSMQIRQIRAGSPVQEQGELPIVIDNVVGSFLVTTIFVLYHYEETSGGNQLRKIIIACVPNGMLQNRYNPTPIDTIWKVGRNAPSRGEPFRARIDLKKLKNTAKWRVQTVDAVSVDFNWDE